MNAPTVPPERSRRVVRVEAEEAFGERLQRLISKAGLRVTAVAERMGLDRTDLYEHFAGRKHVRAAWLELVPEVERLYLAERAAAHGCEVRVVSSSARHSLTHVVRELSDVMSAAATGEADGFISVDEALREQSEWADVEQVMEARREYLRRVISERGMAVTGGDR